MTERSWLYVPGHRPDRFAKACASGADAVIFDLEDAVPLERKGEALGHVVEFLTTEQVAPAAWVRVNAGEAGFGEAAALAEVPAIRGVVVPKADPEFVQRHALAHPRRSVLPLIESGDAVLHSRSIALATNVVTLAMGEVDLAADLGLRPDAPSAVWWSLRTQVVMATAAAGRRGPVGPVSVDFTDLEAYRQASRELRAAGFSGRQAIHPAQVAVINEVFTPSDEEVAQARRLVELADAAQGGVCVDDQGRMVDEAVLRSARRLLGPA